MLSCHFCPQWAQWRVRKPIFDAKDEKKIVAWELISFLCGTHKEEQMSLPENKGLKANFMGASPSWR